MYVSSHHSGQLGAVLYVRDSQKLINGIDQNLQEMELDVHTDRRTDRQT